MLGQHLHIICFGSCYVGALVCEGLRLVLRSSFRRGLSLGLAGLGLILHTLFLVARGVTQTQGLPTSTLFESLVVFAWLLALASFYLLYRRHEWAVGVFVLPVVVIVLAVAGVFADQGPRQQETVHRFWAAVHGLVLLAGAGAVTGAFVAAVMYLVQVRRLKSKTQPADGLNLPNLERLERFNASMVGLGFPLLTVGLAIGALLNLGGVNGPHGIIGWADPKIAATVVCWAIFGVLLHARGNPRLRGRRVALLTVVAFLFMVFALFGVDLLLGTGHLGLENG